MGSHVGSPEISYRVLPDAAPGGEPGVLESIYALAIRKCEQKEAAEGAIPDGRDHAEDSEDDRAANVSVR